MVGSKYGDWKVTKFIGKNFHGLKVYECECPCGYTQNFTLSYMNVPGKLTKCKLCKQKEADEQCDLIGKVVGTWEVISQGKRNKYGSRMWVCKCQCGATKLFLTSFLNGHGIRSATTCKKCERTNNISDQQTVDEIPNRFWTKLVQNSKRRQISFEITREEAFGLFKKQEAKCKLSGLSIYFSKYRQNFNNYTTASLDRIDSTKPYSLNNVQWVHKHINMMKWNFPEDYFIELCGRIHEHATTRG